jgi:uncharacterized protein YwgA
VRRTGLDPVRIQKAMFLLSADLGKALPASQSYSFSPYNYGPMSKRLDMDLDELVAAGLVRELPVSGQSWSRYGASPSGLLAGERSAVEAADVNLPAAKKLWEVKQIAAGKTFDELLPPIAKSSSHLIAKIPHP